jgi:hypothetical protein
MPELALQHLILIAAWPVPRNPPMAARPRKPGRAAPATPVVENDYAFLTSGWLELQNHTRRAYRQVRTGITLNGKRL